MTSTSSDLISAPVAGQNRLLTWVRTRINDFARDWKKVEPFDWRSVLAILVGTIVLTPLLMRLSNLGWEWYHFDLGTWNATYPPWLPITIAPLTVWDWRTGLAMLTSLLLMSSAVGAAREAKTRGRASMLVAALLAVSCVQVFMLMWLGNAVTVVFFGVIALPWGIPFASIQPHISSFAILARRRWTLLAIAFLAASFVIWGWWPPMVMDSMGGAYEHPIVMGWTVLGWPILLVGLVMLIFTNADPLRLMAVGVFLTPYLMPVHTILLVPAVGRARGPARLIIWAAAWTTLFPEMFGPQLWSKYVAMLFPLAVWWFLRPRKEEATSV
jgi:hypothetical protein